MLDCRSPKGLRITPITTDPYVKSHHLYPECPMFTPDSKKFVLFVPRARSICAATNYRP